MSPMRLAVAGAGGRMGRTLIRLIYENKSCDLVGALEARGSASVGRDAGELAGVGELGITINDNPLEVVTRIDGIIDFSVPEASVALAELTAQARIVHVIGTTGFDAGHDAKIRAAARHATIIRSGNMSLGVTLLSALVRKVAAALDEDFDIEIMEMHHRHKIDAPSGTALMLGSAAAEGRNIRLDDHAVMSRVGQTGARPRGAIGFATLRGGGVVGEHSVVFASEAERIELTHRADSREIFARGAVKAALWGRGRKPGLYAMGDVLGIEEL